MKWKSLTGKEKYDLVQEVLDLINKERMTVETACMEVGISKSSFYNHKKVISQSRNKSVARDQLEDKRRITNDKYWGGLNAYSIALELAQLFPYLGIRSLLDIANRYPSWGNRKATYHEMYMFLTRRGLANEEERFEFSKRMNCSNPKCKTQVKWLPSDKYSRRQILSDEKLRVNYAHYINEAGNGFLIDECQSKNNCPSIIPFYLFLPQFEHQFSSYNEFLRKKFVAWVSRQDKEARDWLKKQYPDLLRTLKN